MVRGYNRFHEPPAFRLGAVPWGANRIVFQGT